MKFLNKIKPIAIILGGHVQALGIVRILGRIGVGSVVIENSKINISKHSKYCIESFVVCDQDLLSFILNLGIKGKHKGAIIFPTNDFHVKLLSQNKEDLEKFFLVSTDSWNTIEKFYNKRLTYSIAETLDIPVAKSLFPDSFVELETIDIEYPCIIKPAVMHDFYRKTKKKVLVCKSKKELYNNYQFALQHIPSDEIIIQEIIKGSSRNQFSACFLFLNQKSYVKLCACRMRQHPLDYGNATTYAETVDKPALIELGERILKATHYQGVCEIEFKKDEKDGIYKLLEVNPRTWKWHLIANLANTPFLVLYYNYLNGNAIEPAKAGNKASFRHGITDLSVQLRLLLRGEKHWCQITRPVQSAVWSSEDFRPWLFERVYLPWLIIKR